MVILAGEIVKPAPLQTVLVMVFIEAIGFTVMVTVKEDPVQVPEIGVTV